MSRRTTPRVSVQEELVDHAKLLAQETKQCLKDWINKDTLQFLVCSSLYLMLSAYADILFTHHARKKDSVVNQNNGCMGG